ncbi:DUF732 domain-containing protein [Kribbella sp. NPDC051952]|uniref:DUF732 domain-containing protein n=1 Tax=Kribbella sp. NPDC051952 TaxID=3154851 RepID=UPI0034318B52
MDFLKIVAATIVGRILASLIGLVVLGGLLVLVYFFSGGNMSPADDPAPLSKAGVTVAPENPSEGLTTAPETPETSETYSVDGVAQHNFINAVKESSWSWILANDSDDKIAELGALACTRLQEGATWDEIKTDKAKHNASEVEAIDGVLKLGVKYFCPQYKKLLPSS